MSERFLAIETSSPRLSVALGDGERVVAAHTGTQDWRHADSLFSGIDQLLRRKKWSIQSLTGVAVSVGPGSFTGIRIGLAAARALGQALKIPVLGVSALEIMAAGAPTRSRWLAPQIDALRGQVFSALFEKDSTGRLLRVFSESMVFPAPWEKKVRQHIRKSPLWISPHKGYYPEAQVLMELANSKLLSRGPASYKSVLPLYIREAAAVERKKL